MSSKTKFGSIAAFLVLGSWWFLSILYPPLIIPRISSVGAKIFEILSHAELLNIVQVTFFRLLFALVIGSFGGFVVGFLCSLFRTVREVVQPLIGLLQVIPPVALLILAIIWFGFNGKPAIFIVVTSILPTMVISVQQGLMNIDSKLLEMGAVFKLTKRSLILNVMIPAIKPSLISGWKISLGLACKTMVMGEVLTTPTGIGGALSMARMDLEPETVIAWTVIMILIFYCINNFPRVLKKVYCKSRKIFSQLVSYNATNAGTLRKKTSYA